MASAPSHPNLDVVNAVYRAMAAGDRDALRDLHHPDVVLHVSGHGPHAGDFVGRDQVVSMGVPAEPGQGTGTIEVHDILWTPEHVVVLVRADVERDGDRLHQNIVQVIHVEDGLVREIWEYLWDQQGDKVFWSRH